MSLNRLSREGRLHSVLGRPTKASQGEFDRPGVIAHPDGSVLDHHLQRHRPLDQGGETLALLRGDLPDRQIAQAVTRFSRSFHQDSALEWKV